VVAMATGFALVLILPMLWLWLTAPPDPIYNGKHLSEYLYGQPIVARGRVWYLANDFKVLENFGPRAVPLLAAWLRERDSAMRAKLRNLLQKTRFRWPYLTEDRGQIAYRALFTATSIPEIAIPLSGVLREQILSGDPRQRTESAVLLMYLLKTTQTDARRQIARESAAFISKVLDRFEKTGEDDYALTLLAPMIRDLQITPSMRERVVRLSAKSRYLETAVAALGGKPAK